VEVEIRIIFGGKTVLNDIRENFRLVFASFFLFLCICGTVTLNMYREEEGG